MRVLHTVHYIHCWGRLLSVQKAARHTKYTHRLSERERMRGKMRWLSLMRRTSKRQRLPAGSSTVVNCRRRTPLEGASPARTGRSRPRTRTAGGTRGKTQHLHTPRLFNNMQSRQITSWNLFVTRSWTWTVMRLPRMSGAGMTGTPWS